MKSKEEKDLTCFVDKNSNYYTDKDDFENPEVSYEN